MQSTIFNNCVRSWWDTEPWNERCDQQSELWWQNWWRWSRLDHDENWRTCLNITVVGRSLHSLSLATGRLEFRSSDNFENQNSLQWLNISCFTQFCCWMILEKRFDSFSKLGSGQNSSRAPVLAATLVLCLHLNSPTLTLCPTLCTLMSTLLPEEKERGRQHLLLIICFFIKSAFRPHSKSCSTPFQVPPHSLGVATDNMSMGVTLMLVPILVAVPNHTESWLTVLSPCRCVWLLCHAVVPE